MPTLPAELTDDDQLLVPGEINGTPVKFEISTFPSLTFLYQDATDRLKLHLLTNRYGTRGAGGYYEGAATQVQSLKIGGLALSPRLLTVLMQSLESKKIERLNNLPADQAAGVISPDILSKMDVEFDLADHQVIFLEHAPCPGQVQHWQGVLIQVPFEHLNATPWDEVLLPVTINGKTSKAMLITSANSTSALPGNVMTLTEANRFGIDEATQGVTKAGQIFVPPVALYQYQLPSLTLGDATMLKVPFTIKDTNQAYWYNRLFDNVPITLGPDFLRLNRVYIAYAEHNLYFTPY